MNKSLKGALLSGLVFPGLGQFILKHYMRGTALMLTVLVGMLIIVVKAVQLAFNILDKIDFEGGAIDMTAISSAVDQAYASSDSLLFNFALLLIILCWIIGVVDAYMIGKKMDSKEQSKSRTSNKA